MTEFFFPCLPFLCLPYRSPALSYHCITLVHCYSCFLAFVIELFQKGSHFYHCFKTTNSHTSKKVGYGTKSAVVTLVIDLLLHFKSVKTYKASKISSKSVSIRFLNKKWNYLYFPNCMCERYMWNTRLSYPVWYARLCVWHSSKLERKFTQYPVAVSPPYTPVVVRPLRKRIWSPICCLHKFTNVV